MIGLKSCPPANSSWSSVILLKQKCISNGIESNISSGIELSLLMIVFVFREIKDIGDTAELQKE